MNEEAKSAKEASVREIIKGNITKAEDIYKLVSGIRINFFGIPEDKEEEYKETDNIREEIIYERRILLESITILRELKEQLTPQPVAK